MEAASGLVSALKAARSVVEFVEGGGLEQAIAEIDVRAALAAVAKASMANDPRSQVWSAVNHLEEAEQVLLMQSSARRLLG